MSEMEYTLKLGGKFEVEYTDDIEENRVLLRQAYALLSLYRGVIAHGYGGDDGALQRIDEWLKRAEKAREMNDEETEQGTHQLL